MSEDFFHSTKHSKHQSRAQARLREDAVSQLGVLEKCQPLFFFQVLKHADDTLLIFLCKISVFACVCV